MMPVDKDPTVDQAAQRAMREILDRIGVRGEFFCEAQRERWLAEIDLGEDEPQDKQ